MDKFKCSYCGEEYDDALSRAECELSCDKRIKIKAEKERQDKLNQEKKDRLINMRKHLDGLVKEISDFNQDYKTRFYLATDNHSTFLYLRNLLDW